MRVLWKVQVKFYLQIKMELEIEDVFIIYVTYSVINFTHNTSIHPMVAFYVAHL